jgi:acetyl-CoA carboxylase carboxyl transferase beta subunit/acetyl-CoA carboxylase carboxyl transferase alpha subunit
MGAQNEMNIAEELVDSGSFAPADDGLVTPDPLGFPGYADAQRKAREASEGDESVTAGSATIDGHAVEFAHFSFSFIGGSMGAVAGERLASALERSAERGVPFVLYTSTGGARMQEGMVALVQMAKVVAARQALTRAHQPFIAVLGNPTTGGVLASIAALADITVAEKNATIGFAGPRVAAHFLGRSLSDESHTAEMARRSGLVDDVLDPRELRGYLATVLQVLEEDSPEDPGAPQEAASRARDPWEVVAAARSQARPKAPQLMQELFDTYVALRGDRTGRDDPALGAVIGRIGGRRAVALGLNRDHSPGPGAYRKVRRCIEIAERLDLPIVTIIDTPGANPSEGAETGGVAWEIARTFEALLRAPVPVVCVLTGEGGSGGALAVAVGDVLLAYEDSFFSVIAPEAAATILWRDPGRAEDAARSLKLTAADLQRLGIADAVLAEPLSADSLRRALAYHLRRVHESGPDWETGRLARWRNVGNRETAT